MSTAELACTYAALIIHDEGIAVTAEKIAAIVKAANVEIEPYWPTVFAGVLAKRNIDDLLSGGGSAPPAAAAPSAAASDAGKGKGGAKDAPKKEEKKEEKKKEEPKEEEEDMGFGLFD